MTRLVWWLAAGLLAWSYALFPALVLARGRLRRKAYAVREDCPPVSLIIAAHNEEASIGPKIDSLLRLDYPSEQLEIIVASDGSTDRTVEIVRRYAGHGVRVLDLPRAGKAGALAAGVAEASRDILVFSDANSHFRTDALRALTAPFADPGVGGVAGDQRYIPSHVPEAGAARGERTYWDLDRRMKMAESAAGNVIGASGAIMAIRRRHYRPIAAGVNDDFYLSLSVIANGQRLVFAEAAVALEPVAMDRGAEFRRKVRVLTRGLRCAVSMPRLFDPRRYGFYSLQLFSHKVLMRTMAIPLIAFAAASAQLWRRGPLYRLAALGQLTCYAAAAIGLAAGGRPIGRHKLLAIPSYFVMVNVASLKATLAVMSGRRVDRWTVTRVPTPAEPPADASAGERVA
jgi:cellulose synthase/poly-beta-1,6-N-acetylglucosamine synthase-like glycosyltransferase